MHQKGDYLGALSVFGCQYTDDPLPFHGTPQMPNLKTRASRWLENANGDRPMPRLRGVGIRETRDESDPIRRLVAWVLCLGSALSTLQMHRGKVECRAVGFYLLLSLPLFFSGVPRPPMALLNASREEVESSCGCQTRALGAWYVAVEGATTTSLRRQ